MASNTESREKAPHGAAALFDLRYIIAILFAVYGVVLVVMGAVSFTAADKAKTGDININLWAGIVMIVFAALMALWAKTRPVVMAPDEPELLPENESPEQH